MNCLSERGRRFIVLAGESTMRMPSFLLVIVVVVGFGGGDTSSFDDVVFIARRRTCSVSRCRGKDNIDRG